MPDLLKATKRKMLLLTKLLADVQHGKLSHV